MKSQHKRNKNKKFTLKNCFGLLRKAIIVIILLSGIFLGLPRLITHIAAINKIENDVSNLPERKVAIVFGAGLKTDGSVTRVLRDRVDAAAAVYFEGKVEKILVSGDNRFEYYNEPGAMYEYAVSLGIPSEDIILDYAGRRTYDTCYRAKEIFGVDEAILVTQNFHLPRALFLCNNMKISAIGFNANMSYYLKSSRLVWNVRELPATLVAVINAWITHPIPVLGDKEPIFSD